MVAHTMKSATFTVLVCNRCKHSEGKIPQSIQKKLSVSLANQTH